MGVSKPSRRTVLKTGLAAVAASAGTVTQAHAAPKPKAPGETKVVVMMGDYCHNPIYQETNVRGIFSSHKDWRLCFPRGSRFFTPELLGDADLLITARYSGRDPVRWTGEGVDDTMTAGEPLWTDERARLVIDHVKNRGMGFMAVHCTIFAGSTEIEDLLGIEPVLHQEIQPIIIRDLNGDHPVTQGINPFFINLDEQFDVIIKDTTKTTVLFRSLAVHDKRDSVGGWCLEQGNGRVVGLLPGDTRWPYEVPEYREIFWRAAHWALKRDIPSRSRA
ncbi:ThuA domain-containing protein [bacterium]|nr:ThuA domain-containing protein [bacterium]